MPARPIKGTPIEKTYTGAIPYVPNSVQSFDLEIGSLIEELNFKLTGTCAVAGFTANPTVRAESLENLVNSVRFTANARQNGAQAVELTSVDGSYLHTKTNAIHGTVAERVDIGAANGSYDFETNFTKYFGAKRLRGMADATFLDTRLLQAWKVNMGFRDETALVQPGTGTGPGTVTLSETQITVHSREWQGHQTVGKAPYVRETTRPFDLTNTSGLDREFLNTPVGNVLVRQWFKGCVGDVDYADPSDDFITTNLRTEGAHVKTVVRGDKGEVTRFDSTWGHLQTNNKQAFKLETWPVGYGVIEYSRTGLPSDALNLRGMISAKNLMDITPVAGKTNTLFITDEQVIWN